MASDIFMEHDVPIFALDMGLAHMTHHKLLRGQQVALIGHTRDGQS